MLKATQNVVFFKKKVYPVKELSLLILLIYTLLWVEYFIACARSCVKTAVICIDY